MARLPGWIGNLSRCSTFLMKTKLPEKRTALDRKDAGFVESNHKHTINGYLFGSMPMPTMKIGKRVRWYLLGLGTEADLHTPHWHGNTVTVGGHRVDTVSLLPATSVVADMVPDDPGIWMFHCHVNDPSPAA